MTEEEARVKGEEHWKFLEEREHKTFMEAWMHSWKHEHEEGKVRNETTKKA